MYHRILVATDGSDLSQKAIDSAIELAAICGAKLVAVTVVPHYPQSYFEGGVALLPEEMQLVEQQWADKGQAIVEAVRQTASDKGVATEALAITSDVVSEALVATATKHQCDLIVMASHGRKGIGRLLMGSETQHVLTHTAIPVLVIR